MCANYILACYNADGKELFVRSDGKTRYQFYSRRNAVIAMGKAIECINGVACTKLYRRHRAGGYSWAATRFRDGAHLSAWGE